MLCTLTDFKHLRPRHEIDQEVIQDWIAQAHAIASQGEQTLEEIQGKIKKVGLGKERIAKRGIHIGDLFEKDWSAMEIYPVAKRPAGNSFAERSAFFDREATQIFEQMYPEEADLPGHLIHVTCTGYVFPSPAQKLVSLRGSEKETTVTHAYHMGCYGAIPAIRMGAGFSRLPSASPVDIVHTEICSLHMHPLKHSTEQLLIQNLFGDGFIKYTLQAESPSSTHLKVLALHEEMIPDSTHCMTWQCEENGLAMTLSKEVPVLIARTLEGYLQRLSEKMGKSYESLITEALFAIHPGGPKILQHIQDLLHLQPEQIAHSVHVLKQFGNMSSATVPHIWEQMLADPLVAKGQPIISLAYGPGLSIAGGFFEKG